MCKLLHLAANIIFLINVARYESSSIIICADKNMISQMLKTEIITFVESLVLSVILDMPVNETNK